MRGARGIKREGAELRFCPLPRGPRWGSPAGVADTAHCTLFFILPIAPLRFAFLNKGTDAFVCIMSFHQFI